MKTQKIRFYKRLPDNINRWKENALSIDLSQSLVYTNRCYTKIMVYPWNAISLNGRVFPEPSGTVKRLIMISLLDIYFEWKRQLDLLEKPYYLKVWLFEPRFSKSQVVCAVDDAIDFYNNTFIVPQKSKKLNLSDYGSLADKMNYFNWDYCLDEDYYDNTFVGIKSDYSSVNDYNYMKSQFEKMLKKDHRTEKLKDPCGDISEIYAFLMGDLWIGGID